MKKTVAMTMAAAMALSMLPVSAAEKTSEDVESKEASSTQSGEIWAGLSSDTLKQLKVTVPIKLVFAITGAGSDGHEVEYGSKAYEIKVPTDSEIGVSVTELSIGTVLNSDWKLAEGATGLAAQATETDIYKVAVKLADKQLTLGKNQIATYDSTAKKYTDHKFTVAPGASKDLGLFVTPATKGTIDPDTALSSSKAFDIVYTLEQWKAAS